MSKHLKWGLRRMPRGWAGHIVLSGIGDDGNVRQAVAIARGMSKQEALHNAAAIAQRIASNPYMQSLLPPGTLPILRGVQVLARFGSTPQAKAALRSIASRAPKAMSHLIHRLHF